MQFLRIVCEWKHRSRTCVLVKVGNFSYCCFDTHALQQNHWNCINGGELRTRNLSLSPHHAYHGSAGAVGRHIFHLVVLLQFLLLGKLDKMSNSRLRNLITKGKSQLHDTGDEPITDIDEDLLNIGCAALRRHFFSMFVCMLSGLVTLMYVPGLVQVLKNTGQTDSPKKAFVRYLRTINHMLKWYSYDPKERLQSLKTVRRVHAMVAKNNDITQFDMVVTQWAFVAPALLMPSRIGMASATKRELNGLRYVIYLTGQAIGISDEFNLCKHGLDETIAYSEKILNEIITPGLNAKQASLSDEMADSLLAGMEVMNPLFLATPFKAWCFKIFNSSLAPTLELKLRDSAYDACYFWIIVYLMDTLLIGKQAGLIRSILNTLMAVNIYLGNLWENLVLQDHKRKFL